MERIGGRLEILGSLGESENEIIGLLDYKT
jgi:hypothetical protein